MAWDDPVVWILIIALVVFIFGSKKLPEFARALGQARKEFSKALGGDPRREIANAIRREIAGEPESQPQPRPPGPVSFNPYVAQSQPSSQAQQEGERVDPLVMAAQREGIDTTGKTREQIASELSWKLNKK